QHVTLVDRLESPDARAVEPEPLLERLLAQLVRRHRKVLPQTGQVHEPQVDDLDVVVLDQLQHVRRLSHGGRSLLSVDEGCPVKARIIAWRLRPSMRVRATDSEALPQPRPCWAHFPML